MATGKAAIAATRARIREFRAVIAEADKAETEARAKVAPAQKRKAALAAKQAKMLMLTTSGGTPNAEGGGIRLTTVEHIALSYSQSAPKNAKALAAALLSGEVKISGAGYGVTYTLRGFLRRCKLTDVRRLREVNSAIKRRKAAQAALHRAWKAEADAYIVAMDISDKVDEAAIAALVAARLAIDTAPVIDHALNQRAHDAKRSLEDLDRHLAFLVNGPGDHESEAVCPCYECAHGRQKAIKDRDEKIRLDALPTIMSPCHDKAHGRHRIAIERAQLRLTDDWRKRLEELSPGIAALLPAKPAGYYMQEPSIDAPRGICRKGAEPVAFIRSATLRDELEKAAKAAAKAARKTAPKPKLVTPTATGDPATLDWVCPSCSELSDFDVQDDEDGEGEYVECSSCGYTGDPNVVKTVAKAA